MNYRWLAVGILVLVLVVPVMADTNMHQLSATGLGSFISFMDDEYLYAHEGISIVIYDITSDLMGVEINNSVGSISFPTTVTGINVTGDTMYVVTSWGSLTTGLGTFHIVDITDRAAPVELSNLSYSSVIFKDVESYGDYAYVGGNKLYVFNISNTASPTFVTTITPDYGIINQLDIDANGDYIYGVTYSKALSIWDITDKESPVLANNTVFATSGVGAYGIAYRNDTVYVTDYKVGLYAYDVIDRENPVLFWESPTLYTAPQATAAVDVKICGDYLYLSNRYGVITAQLKGGFYIYDISNNTPVYLGQNGTSIGYTERLSTNGNVLALSGNANGMNIYNVTDKENPVFKTKLHIPTSAWSAGITEVGTVPVYWLGGRDLGVWYYNISDPYNPTKLAISIDETSIPRARSGGSSTNATFITYDGNGRGFMLTNLTPIFDTFSLSWAHNITADSDQAWIAGIGGNDTRVWALGYNIRPAIFETWDITDKEDPVLIDSAEDILKGFRLTSDNTIIKLNDNWLVGVNGTRSGTPPDIHGIEFINITDEYNPTSFNFANTYTVFLNEYSYDAENEIIYAMFREVSDGGYSTSKIVQIDVADLDNVHLNYGNFSNPVVPGYGLGQFARNGTNLFVSDAKYGHILMVDYKDSTSPQLADYVTGLNPTGYILDFYDGYLIAGAETNNDGASVIIYQVDYSDGIPPDYPVVQWTASPTTVGIGEIVQFTDQSYDPSPENTTMTYNWSFDDDTYSTDQNPKHGYSAPGTYDVTLTAYGAEGYNTSDSQAITIQYVTADFYADQTYNETPLFEVTFTSTEQYGTDYEWNFIDGNATVDLTTRNGTYIYGAPGEYAVRYTVTNSSSAETDTKTRTNYIIIGGGECTRTSDPIEADHNAASYVSNLNESWSTLLTKTPATNAGNNNGQLYAGQRSMAIQDKWNAIYRSFIVFPTDAYSESTINGGYISLSKYYSTYALGKPNLTFVATNVSNPLSIQTSDFLMWNDTRMTEEVTYDEVAATTRINLSLTDFGVSAIDKTGRTAFMMINNWDADQIAESPTWTESAQSYFQFYSVNESVSTRHPFLYINFTGDCFPSAPIPDADYIANVSWGAVPLPVQFTDASSNNPTLWSWDFGDGNYSSDRNPVHTFEGPGEHIIMFTATNGAGGDIKEGSIIVQAETPGTPPVAYFTKDLSSGDAPLLVQFNDTSTGNPTSWNWSITYPNETTFWYNYSSADEVCV